MTLTTEILKEHLLANFCDGDSWKEADALSLTKHGALDVAEYFYELGSSHQREAIVEMCEGMSENPPMTYTPARNFYNQALSTLAEKIKLL